MQHPLLSTSPLLFSFLFIHEKKDVKIYDFYYFIVGLNHCENKLMNYDETIKRVFMI